MPLSADTDADLAVFRRFFEMAELDVDETDCDGGRTHLHQAAYNNTLRIAHYLLKRNADASITDEKGYTPLHVAASRGHDFMVGLILKYSSRERVRKFIDAGTRNHGRTALHMAAHDNRYESVRLLLSYGANFEAKDKRGKTPIQLATSGEVKLLLESTADTSRMVAEINVNYTLSELLMPLLHLPPFEYLAAMLARNGQGYTPLQVAVRRNHLLTVQTIGKMRIERSAPECALSESSELLAEKVIALWNRIVKSHLGKLKNEDLNEREIAKEGSAALYCAWKVLQAYEDYRRACKDPLEEPHIKIIEEVLEAVEFDGRNFQEQNDDDFESFGTSKQHEIYYQLLCSEDAYKRQEFINLMEFAICVPMTLLVKYINSSNLLAAVEKGDLKAAKKCMENSTLVDMDIQDNIERRPLLIAITMGNQKMVEFLLSNKANMLLATEKDNVTPLYVAVIEGNLAIAKLLLRSCDVDKVNDYVNAKIKSTGMTALHVAAISGRLDIARTLLEYHAIYCARDNRGKSPSDSTRSAEMKKLFKLIDESFDDAKNGRVEVVGKFKGLERDLLLAVGNACDKEGYSVPQVASLNKHRNIGTKIFKMIIEAKKSKDAEFAK